MKRNIMITLLVMLALTAGSVSAHQREPGYGPGWRGPRHERRQYSRRFSGPPRSNRREDTTTLVWEKVTVTGNLELIDGAIALRQDAVTYYPIGLNRLVGFIDGLKEGARVTLEGAARPLSTDGERRFLAASKLELNGKTYDNLTPPVTDRRGRFSPENYSR
ncbi:MAG: hypothetical protein LBH70_03455 [Spirochaetaceae bacterium]|jgi:hypothetical protein|nr:hypothetical protein [Spirochaetaceae bacterium]